MMKMHEVPKIKDFTNDEQNIRKTKKHEYQHNGITLIALVVTIIVLLILARYNT